MTSKEISTMREQATEMYKKVWLGQMASVRRCQEIQRDGSPDDFTIATDENTGWDNAAHKLKDFIGVLLTLQCYVAERERTPSTEV